MQNSLVHIFIGSLINYKVSVEHLTQARRLLGNTAENKVEGAPTPSEMEMFNSGTWKPPLTTCCWRPWRVFLLKQVRVEATRVTTTID